VEGGRRHDSNQRRSHRRGQVSATATGPLHPANASKRQGSVLHRVNSESKLQTRGAGKVGRSGCKRTRKGPVGTPDTRLHESQAQLAASDNHARSAPWIESHRSDTLRMRIIVCWLPAELEPVTLRQKQCIPEAVNHSGVEPTTDSTRMYRLPVRLALGKKSHDSLANRENHMLNDLAAGRIPADFLELSSSGELIIDAKPRLFTACYSASGD
jgi:hypothetical protein